jgi:hypothetical protein
MLCAALDILRLQPADFEDVPAATSSKPTDSDWFGPHIPLTGLTGRLKLGSPDVFGCSPLDFGELPAATQHSDRRAAAAGDHSNSDSKDDTGSTTAYSQLSQAAGAARDGPLPIIALLARSLPLDASNCHFDTKVLVQHNCLATCNMLIRLNSCVFDTPTLEAQSASAHAVR